MKYVLWVRDNPARFIPITFVFFILCAVIYYDGFFKTSMFVGFIIFVLYIYAAVGTNKWRPWK